MFILFISFKQTVVISYFIIKPFLYILPTRYDEGKFKFMCCMMPHSCCIYVYPTFNDMLFVIVSYLRCYHPQRWFKVITITQKLIMSTTSIIYLDVIIFNLNQNNYFQESSRKLKVNYNTPLWLLYYAYISVNMGVHDKLVTLSFQLTALSLTVISYFPFLPKICLNSFTHWQTSAPKKLFPIQRSHWKGLSSLI